MRIKKRFNTGSYRCLLIVAVEWRYLTLHDGFAAGMPVPLALKQFRRISMRHHNGSLYD
jgi:hypothetical protein